MRNEIYFAARAVLKPGGFVCHLGQKISVNRRANTNSIKIFCVFTEEMPFISILRRESVQYLCYNQFSLSSNTFECGS